MTARIVAKPGFLWMAVLLSCSGIASAELVVVPFEQSGFSIEHSVELIETSQGDLVVQTSVTEFDLDEKTGVSVKLQRPTQRTFLDVMRQDGTSRRRIELPGALDAMMPLEASGETFLRVIEDARQKREERERQRR